MIQYFPHSLHIYSALFRMANRVIPVICAKYPLAHFIIGGDGPKKLLLEEMKERNLLHDRVELLGEVPHGRVRDVSSSPSLQHLLSQYIHTTYT